MIPISNDLEPTPTQRSRSWAFLGTRDSGTLVLLRNGEPTTYHVQSVPEGGWVLAKDGELEAYRVQCGSGGVCCNCKGFVYRSRCIHSAAWGEVLLSEVFGDE